MPTLRDIGPRHLEALVAVADEGTFARAADRLGFTQSAISQQIAALERAAGRALFDRPKGPRPVELTHAGEMVLTYARSALRRIDAIDAELNRLRRGLTARLVVGTFQSVTTEILPTVLGRMRDELPDVEIQLVESDDLHALVDGVLADDFDLVFAADLEPTPQLDAVVLGYDPFVVIAPAGWVVGETVTAAELDEHTLVGQPGDDAQQMIDRRLADIGVRPHYDYRFQDNQAVQAMVRNGLGWSVMPSLAIDATDPGIDVLRPDPPVPARRIQLVRRAGRTLPPAVDRFAEISSDASRALLDPTPGEGGIMHAHVPA